VQTVSKLTKFEGDDSRKREFAHRSSEKMYLFSIFWRVNRAAVG
jgi:hypothetical protein